ncbi:MAG: hypothetical protein EOO63_14335 [Hymenobacter sp.]|nr:MAG: hypothetical protein EOO63_14335 [Hymenobacter sp.]
MPTKQIHLEVQAKQYRFVLKLLEALPFVRVSQPEEPVLTAEQQANYENVAQGFKELKLMRQGKLQAQPIQDLLDELSG